MLHSHSQNHSAESSACISILSPHPNSALSCVVFSTSAFSNTQLVFTGYHGRYSTSTGRRHVGKLLTIWYSVLAGESLCSHVLLLDIFLRDVMLGFTACRQQRWGLFVLYSTLFRSVVSLIWCYHLIFIGSDSSYVCSSFTPLLILIPSDPPVLSSSLLRSTLASRDSCLPRDWKPSLT